MGQIHLNFLTKSDNCSTNVQNFALAPKTPRSQKTLSSPLKPHFSRKFHIPKQI